MTLKDIRRFYQACNPANALDMSNPMDAQYYMDFSSVRGGQIIRQMEKNIWNEQDKATCQLFTGHIGCGKSTELHKLEDNLKKKDYHVVYFEAKHDLDMSDVDITDILLAIARQVSESLEKSYEFKIRPGRFNQLLEGIGKFLSVEFTAGAEIDIPTILGKIKLTTKATPGVRSQLRQYLEPQTPNVLALLNEQILGEANKFLKDRGKQGLVVIVDDLDRVDNRQKDNSNRTQPEYLFVDRGEQLSKINCHVIYTIPLVLLYSEPQALSQKFGGHIAKILPMVPVTTREGKDHAEGLSLLRQMLMKRAVPNEALTEEQRLDFIPEVFDSPETLERLCRVSGGHSRNILAMLQSCLNEEDPPLSRKSLEKVIRDYRDSLLTAITPEDETLLRQVKQQQDVRGAKEQQTLLRTLLVYEYHDETGKWYEINPILLESEKFRDKLAQLPV
jgi:nucleoside-triphosphatase THEP1